MRTFRTLKIVTGLVGGIVLFGCDSIGNAPSGGSPAEVESNFKKEDPQQQIRVVQNSPASPEKKAALIKEIEARTGVKAAPAGPSSNAPNPMANGAPAGN